MTTNSWDNYDPSLPYWVDLEAIGVEETPCNLKCEEKDFEDLI